MRPLKPMLTMIDAITPTGRLAPVCGGEPPIPGTCLRIWRLVGVLTPQRDGVAAVCCGSAASISEEFLHLLNDLLNVLPVAIEKLRLPPWKVTQLDDLAFLVTVSRRIGLCGT